MIDVPSPPPIDAAYRLGPVRGLAVRVDDHQASVIQPDRKPGTLGLAQDLAGRRPGPAAVG